MRYGGEVRVAGQPEDLFLLRIDRNDGSGITLPEQRLDRAVPALRRIAGRTDDGDRLRLEDITDRTGHGLELLSLRWMDQVLLAEKRTVWARAFQSVTTLTRAGLPAATACAARSSAGRISSGFPTYSPWHPRAFAISSNRLYPSSRPGFPRFGSAVHPPLRL